MQLQTTNYNTFTLGSIQFTGHKLANHCLPGDLVDFKDNKCVLIKRASHRFIPGVLELTSKTIYGYTSRGAKLFLFHPHDRKYPPFRVGSSCKDTSRNQLGLVEFMEWEDHETLPRGNLIRLLGPCGELEKEKEALTYEFSDPQTAKETFDIADVQPQDYTLLEGFTFNVDPDGCMDIDDVLTVKQLSNSEWQFVITIADVANYILENTEGDKHAQHLGQTLYQNGDAIVPMLPPPLSELAFSLRPREVHTGISLFCTWNTETKHLTIGEFKETKFKNNMSFTYETVYKLDEFPLSILQDIASYLHGSLTTDSHEWIAEYMILYNKEVAKKLLEHNIGLLRTHKPADTEKLQQFVTIHPELKVLAYEAANYELTAADKLHATLGNVPYCHASSPIRRYADLLNQRCLKAILKGKSIAPCSQKIADHLNKIQKRMRAYERALFFLEKVAEVPSGTVEGVVVLPNKVYIPSWKQMIKLNVQQYAIGQTLNVTYYANLSKPHWDERMVFCINTKANEDAKHDE